MSVGRNGIPWLNEVIQFKGFLAEPFLVFGKHDSLIPKHYFTPNSQVFRRTRMKEKREVRLGKRHPDLSIPEWANAKDLTGMLKKMGIKRPLTLDLFDPSSELKYDMNFPVPRREHSRYNTFMDVGCLEHVFDTRQCMENSLRMIRTGGFYYLSTWVKGGFRHGLHTFNLQGLADALQLNGFEIIYMNFTDQNRLMIKDILKEENVIITLVGKKKRELKKFVVPQQRVWKTAYKR